MNISRMRRYRRNRRYFRNLLAENPMLVLGLDLPFVIATTVNLRGAAAMSVEMFIIHVGTMMAALITGRFLSGWARTVANVSVSTVLMAFTRLLLISLFRGVSDVLGMYIYLMAVNGMTLVQASMIGKDSRPGPVLVRAFMSAASFSLTVLFVSLLREWIGNGSVWDVPVPVPIKLTGVLIPFSGFLIVGFFFAGARFLNKRLRALYLIERTHRSPRLKPGPGK